MRFRMKMTKEQMIAKVVKGVKASVVIMNQFQMIERGKYKFLNQHHKNDRKHFISQRNRNIWTRLKYLYGTVKGNSQRLMKTQIIRHSIKLAIQTTISKQLIIGAKVQGDRISDIIWTEPLHMISHKQ
ncbi:MAG: hypothetical protein EZS28_051387, partial [Streblomastix strix]